MLENGTQDDIANRHAIILMERITDKYSTRVRAILKLRSRTRSVWKDETMSNKRKNRIQKSYDSQNAISCSITTELVLLQRDESFFCMKMYTIVDKKVSESFEQHINLIREYREDISWYLWCTWRNVEVEIDYDWKIWKVRNGIKIESNYRWTHRRSGA